jgi:hypothetical protein
MSDNSGFLIILIALIIYYIYRYYKYTKRWAVWIKRKIYIIVLDINVKDAQNKNNVK